MSQQGKGKQSKRQETCLDGVVTTVHVIAKEEVFGGGRITANLKELHQIVELAVNVSAHCNGRQEKEG